MQLRKYLDYIFKEVKEVTIPDSFSNYDFREMKGYIDQFHTRYRQSHDPMYMLVMLSAFRNMIGNIMDLLYYGTIRRSSEVWKILKYYNNGHHVTDNTALDILEDVRTNMYRYYLNDPDGLEQDLYVLAIRRIAAYRPLQKGRNRMLLRGYFRTYYPLDVVDDLITRRVKQFRKYITVPVGLISNSNKLATMNEDYIILLDTVINSGGWTSLEYGCFLVCHGISVSEVVQRGITTKRRLGGKRDNQLLDDEILAENSNTLRKS